MPSIGLSRIFSIMCSIICCPRMVHCWALLRFIGLSLGGSTSLSSSCFNKVVATFDQSCNEDSSKFFGRLVYPNPARAEQNWSLCLCLAQPGHRIRVNESITED